MSPPSPRRRRTLGTTLSTVPPKQPPTPRKSFRIRQDLYLRAQAAARWEGRGLAEVVRQKLEEYVTQVEKRMERGK